MSGAMKKNREGAAINASSWDLWPAKTAWRTAIGRIKSTYGNQQNVLQFILSYVIRVGAPSCGMKTTCQILSVVQICDFFAPLQLNLSVAPATFRPPHITLFNTVIHPRVRCVQCVSGV
jgi:hypothetical protein